MQLLDLYPTLADLAGLPPPTGIEGRSVAQLLAEPKTAWEHPAFAVVMFQGKLGRSVVSNQWHYVEWDQGRAGAMLLDHRSDPLELKNLVDDPQFTKKTVEMKQLLDQIPPLK